MYVKPNNEAFFVQTEARSFKTLDNLLHHEHPGIFTTLYKLQWVEWLKFHQPLNFMMLNPPDC